MIFGEGKKGEVSYESEDNIITSCIFIFPEAVNGLVGEAIHMVPPKNN